MSELPRAIVTEALTLELVHEPVPAEQVVAGEPTVGVAQLGVLGKAELDAAELGAVEPGEAEPGSTEYGVWEHSVGASSDVETDEVFVVLAGRATVAFDDGTVLDLGPGSVGRLYEGQRTVWTITETLRKIYVA